MNVSALHSDATDQTAMKTLIYTLRSPGLWLIIALILVFASIAEGIGAFTIPLGIASITLLPMIWGLLLGLIASAQRIRPMPVVLQNAATAIMGVAVIWLCARLSLTLGPNLPLIVEAGPALLIQELGNIFGPIMLALPLAVLLRMGPATVGATFSLDREASFAMVTERFGSNSPQYRGVLSMYIYGTLFGAIIVSVIASLAASLNFFDPLALAMGSGMGSGSMLAAGSAAVAAEYPEMGDQIVAIATTANVIAAVFGVYLGVWVALPLADRLYRLLTKRQKPRPKKVPGAPKTEALTALQAANNASPNARVPLWTSLLILSGAGVLVSIIGSQSFSADMITAHVLVAALAALSIGLAKLARGKVPALIIVITMGAVVTSPISPIADWVLEVTAPVDFLSAITVMLSVAGLTLGKDLPLLKGIGWKIIPVGAVVVSATFIMSVFVAETVLRLLG